MPRTSDSHFTVICGCVLSLVLNDWSETECLRVDWTVVSNNFLHSPKLSLLLLLLLEKTNLSKLQGQVTKSIKQYSNRLKTGNVVMDCTIG